jgi:predicted TIM-barrel fold metal-dependent hydrolase
VLRRRSFLTSSLAFAATASLPCAAQGAPLAPFKLYDTHAHFYTNDVERYPFKPDITEAARARAMETPMSAETIFQLWDEVGVEMGCGVQYNTTYSTDNRYLLDVSEQFPERITSIVILDATDAATPVALEAMARAYGISGVRFAGVPEADGSFTFLTDAAHSAWEAANELELAVVLMPRRSDQAEALPAAMARIGALAAQYPKVTIVLDHIGYPAAETSPTFGFSPEHLALAAHQNIFYKYTSFLMHILNTEGGAPARDFLNYVIDVYGAERMVWGSDVGNTHGEFRELVRLALESAQDLTPDQKRAMFYDNAKALFVPGGRALARARGDNI